MADHPALRTLTAGQHGVVSRRQLADLGYSRQAVAHAVSSGRLHRLTRRVLRLAGSAETVEQRAMAASLDLPGGAVGLHSAAAMWGMPSFLVEPVHVLTDRHANRGAGHLGVVHSTVRWGPDDTTALHGIPITTPLRTLCDLAGRIHPDRLSTTCDRMLNRRLLRLEQLHHLLAVLPPHGGTPGTRALRALVAARPPGHRPPESNLERRFERILDRAGDAPFERQVDLGEGTRWIGRVDFVDRALRIVVEIQSDLFHSGVGERARDAERRALLERAGWTVVEVTEHEVWHRPDLVVARIRAARRGHRGRRLVHPVTTGLTNRTSSVGAAQLVQPVTPGVTFRTSPGVGGF